MIRVQCAIVKAFKVTCIGIIMLLSFKFLKSNISTFGGYHHKAHTQMFIMPPKDSTDRKENDLDRFVPAPLPRQQGIKHVLSEEYPDKVQKQLR